MSTPVMKELPASLAKLREYPQFILVNADKVPVDVSGTQIDAHDPVNWMRYDIAIATADQFGYQVGFVITKEAGFWFLDIDHCIDANGQYSPIAQELLSMFRGAATEISISRTGLHIFGYGKAPEHSCKNADLNIEFYTDKRVVLLTGTDARGNVWLDWTPILRQLVPKHFQPNIAAQVLEWRDTPVPEWNGPVQDDVLIAKLMQQKKFGGRASVADLLVNNEAVLAANYAPINPNDPYDRSSADQALANHLAFWCGKNHDRIWRIMCASQLYRPKWIENKNYLANTIRNAVNNCEDVYGSKKKSNSLPLSNSTLSDGGYPIKPWGDLSGILFAPMRWVIKSLLPPGISLFAGRPKQGKSWMVHAIGLLVAAGEPVFGYMVNKSDVLYMALEDSERRLQGRTRKLMKSHGLNDEDIRGFHYSTDAPRLGEGLEEYLTETLLQYPNIRLIIIDVLARIRPPQKGNQGVYAYDYDVGKRLKGVGAMYPDVAFFIVHHQNKSQGDNLDLVSGTHGLAGGFDNIFGLNKGVNGLELHIDGRDIEDSSPIPLTKGDDGMWTLASRSEATESVNSDTRNAIVDAIGDETMRPKKIADLTELDANTVSASLRRMLRQGIVEKNGYGWYKLAQNTPI